MSTPSFNIVDVVVVVVVIRNVWNRFFYFRSVSVLFLKNFNLVQNEIGLVQFKKRGLVRIL